MDPEEITKLFSPVTGPHVKIFGWLERVLDISVMVGVLFEATDNSQDAFAARLAKSANARTLFNRRLFQGSDDQIAKAQVEIETQMRSAYDRKVADWPVVVLNMGLPMVCTVLEGYLTHVLELCGEVRPDLIMKKSKTKILGKMVAEAGSFEKVLLAEDRRNFEFSSDIRSNFKTLVSYLDIKLEEIFCMKAFDDHPKYKGWDIEKMVEIFKLRNGIIHRAEYPLTSFDDLMLYQDFIIHVMFNLAWLAADTLKVPLDYRILDVKAGADRIRERCPE